MERNTIIYSIILIIVFAVLVWGIVSSFTTKETPTTEDKNILNDGECIAGEYIVVGEDTIEVCKENSWTSTCKEGDSYTIDKGELVDFLICVDGKWVDDGIPPLQKSPP